MVHGTPTYQSLESTHGESRDKGTLPPRLSHGVPVFSSSSVGFRTPWFLDCSHRRTSRFPYFGWTHTSPVVSRCRVSVEPSSSTVRVSGRRPSRLNPTRGPGVPSTMLVESTLTEYRRVRRGVNSGRREKERETERETGMFILPPTRL